MTPAYLMHRIPSRVRLRIRDKRGDTGFLAGTAETLSRCEAVERVRYNATTGSLVVSLSGSFDSVAEFAEREGLFEVRSRSEPAKPPLDDAYDHGVELDRKLKQRTSGAWGLRTMGFYALMGVGTYQLLQGRVAAVSMYWYALDLLQSEARRDRSRG